MDTWIEIRRKARLCHANALKKSEGDRRAKAIIDAAIADLDLEVRYYEPGTLFDEGVFGSLDRLARVVNVAKKQSRENEKRSLEDEQVVIAHEIGHYILHTDPINEVTIRSNNLGGDPVDGAAGKVEGYSPRERKELQADIFAGEFLCPSDWLREEYVAHGNRPKAIASELGLPPTLVMNQVIRALLLPPLRPAAVKLPPVAVALDSSQQTAATWNQGPLLVDAGPGTGKTRTLVHRVKYCLKNGASPASILALTFSNKAAEEMGERLATMDADAAVQMWVGTFHSFGLEIITKWPSAIGRSGKVKILDEAAALKLLEDNLEKLPLQYYQNLYEPAYELVHVLRAISRCKDELISPGHYKNEAQQALDDAVRIGNEEGQELALRALEIAAIYEAYEQLLQEADAVDFGDLVSLAVSIVEMNADTRNYIAQFKHILVDEYQDVNLASARLLQAIHKAGALPWVVADQRQSIYRFRGAEPTNVERFQSEFNGGRHPLSNNYRSFSPVVRTFESFSASMGESGAMTGAWEANRAAGGQVLMTVAPHVTAEGESIRDKIETFRAAGIPYIDQAILARTHLTLARITGVLEKLGVPLLYMGDLFERSEIRDLLSLIGLGSERGDIGFARVAALPDYQVGREDALCVLQWVNANQVTLHDALGRVEEIPDISVAGRVGLTLISQHLSGLEHASPWTLLTTWLFERSGYLSPLLASNDVIARQKLIAIYQLLKVCGEQGGVGAEGRKQFLARIRRIEALNQDTAYRAVSSEATDIDAVRVMTLHGSKGLEFGAVHFPALATAYMPTNRHPIHCHPPQSLSHLVMQPSAHDAEEECLFFVGLSRARDYLSLSRAEKYTASRKSSPSKFLDGIGRSITSIRYDGSGILFEPDITLSPQQKRDTYPERDLSTYMKCPARYRYEIVERLRGGRDESPYLRFHSCVYATVGWLESACMNGHSADLSAGLARLNADWEKKGPVGHGFEAYYRRAAERMVQVLCEAMAAEKATYASSEWLVPVGNSRISIRPDRVLITPDGVVHVQRIRTGRKTKSEPDDPIYSLLRRGAEIYHPGEILSIETFYLSTSEVVSVAEKGVDRQLEKYADMIISIENGDFQPKPSQRNCPNCASYFTCGTA